MLHGVINVLSQVYLLGYSRKKTNRGGWGYTFLKIPLEVFIFFTWLLKFPDKKLNPWIFHKIVLNPWEIPRPKAKTPGNSTLFFLGHPRKFHFVFNWPLEIPHAISLIPLEIPYPQPSPPPIPSPLFGFFLE